MIFRKCDPECDQPAWKCWFDNSPMWQWIHNGPLWFLCKDCRETRRM